MRRIRDERLDEEKVKILVMLLREREKRKEIRFEKE